MDEVWHDIPGDLKLSRYEVSNTGKVRNKKSGYILNVKPKKTGYVNVTLTNDDKKLRTLAVHILVAKAFIPPSSDTSQNTVDHINRIRSDNRVENLRWASKSEQRRNSAWTTRSGRPVLQLSLEGEIIKVWDKIADVAKELDISSHHISSVCANRRTSCGGFKWQYYEEYIKGEVWKKYSDIQISDHGRVRTKSGVVSYGSVTSAGYMVCTYNNSTKSKLVHILVAKLFIPNSDQNKKLRVNHKDGNPKNNKVSNLEWTTPKGNAQHANKMGLIKRSKNLSIPVKQYDIFGTYIKTFESMCQASKELGIHHHTISKVCNGIFEQTGGYIFKFENENFKDIPRARMTAKKIDHIDENGNIIKTYNSAKEAGTDLKQGPSNIHLVCRGKYKQINGYYFKYSERSK